jgi:predicted nucleotidyltransferase
LTNFGALLERLANGQVEFVVIGGLAVLTHGHVRATLDVDICYARTPENIARLVQTLSPIHPRLRGAPPGLPFFFDAQTLRSGLNFTLVTDEGEIDLLGEVAGVGGYSDMVLHALETDAFGVAIRLMSLDDLIRSKAAAGRPKDLLDLEALRALRKLSKPDP